MRPKKILIVGKEELLISGLLTHLQNLEKIQVYQYSKKKVDGILAEIRKVEPDAILMDDSFTSIIGDIFSHFPDDQCFHFVIINTKENKLQILDTKRIEIHTMVDIINVL